MNLAAFQQELVDDLYEILVTDDENKGITILGDVGSGKSTIALSIANPLMEGWTIFYIEGIDLNLSPYTIPIASIVISAMDVELHIADSSRL